MANKFAGGPITPRNPTGSGLKPALGGPKTGTPSDGTNGPAGAKIFKGRMDSGSPGVRRSSDARGQDGATSVTTSGHRSDKSANIAERAAASDAQMKRMHGAPLTKEDRAALSDRQVQDMHGASSLASSGTPQNVGSKTIPIGDPMSPKDAKGSLNHPDPKVREAAKQTMQNHSARKAAKGKSKSGGGGGGDQPRVPAGDPDGGQFTNK